MHGKSDKMVVGVAGAGTMGAGIAQVAATFGHEVVLWDAFPAALQKGRNGIEQQLGKLVEKGKLDGARAQSISSAIRVTEDSGELRDAGLVIEAIVEDREIKQRFFQDLERFVSPDCLLATNTSSLSIALLGSALKAPGRFVGLHFFNPAPLMPLVEIIPGVASDESSVARARAIVESWDKVAVVAKDTPGFIVNRVARPYYGEALRILEERMADVATIDWAMKEIGGFRMGPFELMDFIGNDINFKVTQTVFEEFFFDPRYRPALTQKRMVEAGRLGKKSGRGYYDYSAGAQRPEPRKDRALGESVVWRIVSMLINEAVDALYLGIASATDIDLAMTKGVNYPKGPLSWAEEIGAKVVYDRLRALQEEYGEDRYRPSALFRRVLERGGSFFTAV